MSFDATSSVNPTPAATSKNSRTQSIDMDPNLYEALRDLEYTPRADSLGDGPSDVLSHSVEDDAKWLSFRNSMHKQSGFETPRSLRSIMGMKRGRACICTALMAALFSQSGVTVTLPLWLNRLGHCGDPFVAFLITTWVYPVLFFISAVVMWSRYRDSAFGFLQKYSVEEHRQIMFTGLIDALNGALVLPASQPSRTPPIIASLISNLMLLPMIIIKHYHFGLRGIQAYKTKSFVSTVILYFGAAYTIVYVPAHNSERINTDVYWWLVYFVGCVFGFYYNLQQEIFFKERPDAHHHMTDYAGYLFWQTFYLMVFGWAFAWLDVIPRFGNIDITGESDTRVDEQVRCNLRETIVDSWYTTPALFFNIAFNLCYYINYIGAAVVNREDFLHTTFGSVLSTALVAIVSYPITELTPDKAVVDIGLVPLTLVLSTAAAVSFTDWARRNRVFSEHGLGGMPPHRAVHTVYVDTQGDTITARKVFRRRSLGSMPRGSVATALE